MKPVTQCTKDEVRLTNLKDLIHMGIIEAALGEKENSVTRRNFNRFIHAVSIMLNANTIADLISIPPNTYFRTYTFGYKSMITVHKLANYVNFNYAMYHGRKDLKSLIYEGYKVYI